MKRNPLSILHGVFSDKEKKAKLFYWVWILSLLMMLLGYIIIFYVLFWKK